MSSLYDTIGLNYANLRRPDPRIARQVEAALGDAETLLNVGAGAGSYEPSDRRITAVEPSAEMIKQRPVSDATVMSVVQLPGGEIQPAMKSGLIDAAEFNNPTSDRDFGMQDVSKHYHLASFHQSQEFFEITFNKQTFDSLPAEHQAILKHASEAENSNFYWHNTKRYSEDLAKLREQGVNVYRTPDSVMAEQLKAWDVVVDRISAEDEFFAKVIASQKAYAKEVMDYLNLNQPDYKLAYAHYFG